MAFLTALWLPILLSSILVFIASSILHMVIPIHRADYRRLPNEEAVRAAIRAAGVGAGQFLVPCPASMKDMGSPEMLAKYREGPNGTLILRPNGTPAIGKSLVQWFLYSVLLSVVIAYIAFHTLAPGVSYLAVFRVVGAVAMLGYAFSYIPDSIWKGLGWNVTAKFIFDGVIYALLTAGTFGWLWPQAA